MNPKLNLALIFFVPKIDRISNFIVIHILYGALQFLQLSITHQKFKKDACHNIYAYFFFRRKMLLRKGMPRTGNL